VILMLQFSLTIREVISDYENNTSSGPALSKDTVRNAGGTNSVKDKRAGYG
jgi:hypothetical protein